MRKLRVVEGCFLSLALLVATAANAAGIEVARQGYVLQVQQQGEGDVTVVFESGFGQGGDAWKDVIADLGAQCSCISYARAGLGKSGTDGKPKTIDEHLQDLGAVIDAVAPGTKVLLVGHSYGGLLATEFARMHPERLLGLVLVDPATMGQRHDTLKADRERVLADDAALLGMLPPHLAADYTLLVSQLESDAALAPRELPDVPVALLTATQVAAEPFVFEETAEGKMLWQQQHEALFAGFARGRHDHFETGHNIHREDPAAVADAVRYIATFPTGQ